MRVNRVELAARVLAYSRATGLDWAAETLELAQHGPPADYQTNMGWVRIAVHNAFWHLHLGSFLRGHEWVHHGRPVGGCLR